MIRVNDRDDATTGSVPLDGAQVVETSPLRRSFTVPAGEFTALLASGARPERFLVAIGDPDVPEGVEPDIWRGVLETWQATDGGVLVTVRAARTVEEVVHP